MLGCASSPLTFHSQQRRACNLAWALSATGRLGAGVRVAVIGGGLAGLTATACLGSLGCEVSLFEREPDVMRLQAAKLPHCHIHPSIIEWPEPGWNEPAGTTLPWLNWNQGTVESVWRDVVGGVGPGRAEVQAVRG